MKWQSINYRILVGLGVLIFFCVALLYAVEISYFNRYFSFSRLIIIGAVFGLAFGVAGAWYWSRRMSESYDRLRLWVGLLVAGLFFGPLFFSVINRHLDPWPARWENVEWSGIEDRFSSRFGIPSSEEMPEANSFNLYFYRNTSLIRIIFNKKPDLAGAEKGDLIGIKVRRGLFGVEWVQAVGPANAVGSK